MKLFISLFCIFTNLVNAEYFVALKQQNVNILFNLLENVSDPFHEMYGQYWSFQDINQLLAPPMSKVTQLMNYANDENLDCEWFGDALKCKNNPLPLSQFEMVTFIEENPSYPKKFHGHQQPFTLGEFIGREVLLSLYNITNSSAQNASVCAVEYQGQSGFSMSDLYLHQLVNNENIKTITHKVGNDVDNDEETQLDVQMMSQTAENVDLWFWDGSAWLYSFAVDFFNTANVPDVLSMSWGWSESDQCSITQCNNLTSHEYVDRVNVEYAKLGLRGVTIVVASGDAGAPGRTNELCANNLVNAVFPGGSPYVTSVGATFVQPNVTRTWDTFLCKKYGCNAGTSQYPTNYNDTGWTTGGGFSNYSPRAKWQDQEVQTYLQECPYFPPLGNKTGRGYPDVSAVGHNCPVISNGYLSGVDGTSCSAPIFAAIVALLNDHQQNHKRPKLGFANPLLYSMSDTFTDIVQGNNHCTEYQCCSLNYGYEATTGWDPVTGLGTPNVGKMVERLDLMFK